MGFFPPGASIFINWRGLEGTLLTKVAPQEQASRRDDFKPFYEFNELESYRLYFDPKLRNTLW